MPLYPRPLPGLPAARQRAHLTQQQLASRAGIGTSALARLEQGRTEARAYPVWKLARALAIPPEELTGGVPLELTKLAQAKIAADSEAVAS